MRTLRGARDFTSGELDAVARWCRENTPEGSRILVHDAGYMGYASGRTLIDLVGLKTPSSIPVHKRFTASGNERDRAEAIGLIAETQCPGYVVVLSDWDNIYHITKALRDRGWGLTCLRPARMDIMKSYIVYRLEQPAAEGPGDHGTD
jgi:hypothetical protein